MPLVIKTTDTVREALPSSLSSAAMGEKGRTKKQQDIDLLFFNSFPFFDDRRKIKCCSRKRHATHKQERVSEDIGWEDIGILKESRSWTGTAFVYMDGLIFMTS